MSDEEERRERIARSQDVDELLDGLGDESWRVRKEAASRLGARPEAAARLAALLQHDEVGRRAAAADALAQLGTAAVPALLETLAAQPPRRRFVIDALGAAGDRAAVPALVGCMDDVDENVRAAAAEALGVLGGDDAVAAVRRALRRRSLVVRHAALQALLRAGAGVPLDELTPLLDEPMLRAPTLALLGQTGDPAAIPWLLAALRVPVHSHQAAAIHALDALPPAAVADALRASPDLEPVLVAALDTDDSEEAAWLLSLGSFPGAAAALATRLTDPALEETASRALLALGEAAVPALVATLNQGEAVAAHVLGDLGAVSAIPALLAALDRDEPVASAAARALGIIAVSAPDAVRPHLFPLDARRCRILVPTAADRPLLLAALREGDAGLRAAAATALDEFVDVETRDALIFALADEDVAVRAAAATTLGAGGHPAAAAALETAAADPDPRVRAAVARALGQLRRGADALRVLVREGGRPAPDALEALAQLGDPADRPLFSAALGGDDPELIKVAIRFGHLAGRDIVPLLGHPRWDVRCAAAEVLRDDPEAAAAVAARRSIETDPQVLAVLNHED
jgi:HEAT repeat protein